MRLFFKAVFLLLISVSIGIAAVDTLKAIDERTKPVGEVDIQTATTDSTTTSTATPRTGKAVYEAHCVACHGSGAAGAPKFGDKAAWQPRIAKGMDTLYEHAIKGFNMMPAKGTCTECSEEEIKNAVTYMVDAAKN